jgi:MFS family permease
MDLHQAAYAMGMFGGPWISGWLADLVGIRLTFGATAALCLALAPSANRWLKGDPTD